MRIASFRLLQVEADGRTSDGEGIGVALMERLRWRYSAEVSGKSQKGHVLPGRAAIPNGVKVGVGGEIDEFETAPGQGRCLRSSNAAIPSSHVWRGCRTEMD